PGLVARAPRARVRDVVRDAQENLRQLLPAALLGGQPLPSVKKAREPRVGEHREHAEDEQRHEQLDQRETASASRGGLHLVASPCGGGVLPIWDRSPVCDTVEPMTEVALCSTKPVSRTSGTLTPGSITLISTRRILATGVTPVSCTQWNLRPPIS